MTLMETAQLLGNFGEFVGAFAVVATLFYLAVQVRHSKEATQANTRSIEQSQRASRAQVRNSITEQIVQINSLMLSQPELLAAMASTDDNLNENEVIQLRTLAFIWLKHSENVHYQYRQGLYDESEYRAQREIWRDRLQEPRSAWRDVWANRRMGFSPPFAQEIDKIIAESAA